MSNPEKMKVDDADNEEKREDSDEQCSDEESAMREIVLALPALSISTEIFGVDEEEDEARLNEQAVVAAELVMAAAAEAAMKEKSDGKKKKVRRQRKTMKLNNDDEAGGSSKGGEEKKPRKKTSEYTNLPRGPPVCNVCGRAFRSWKAVYGHLRSHKERNYRGFFPPPRFFVPTRGVVIPGPNSAFVPVVARGGRFGVVVAAGGGGGAPGGGGERGVGIDLNVDQVKEDDQEVSGSGTVAKFDLNKSPPEDEDEEDKTK